MVHQVGEQPVLVHTIEVFVGRLRKKLAVDLIQTVRGLGYLIDAGTGGAIERLRHGRQPNGQARGADEPVAGAPARPVSAVPPA
jgi:hypothetical protein